MPFPPFLRPGSEGASGSSSPGAARAAPRTVLEAVVFEALRSLGAGLLVAGSDGSVLFASESASETFGIPAERFAGLSLAELLPEAMKRPSPDASWHANDFRPTCSVRRPDGKQAVIGFQVTEVAAPGSEPGSTCLVFLFRDITHTETLRQERDRLVRLAAVGEVLPSILHELKNPLAAISTTVEVLLEEVGEGSVQDQLHAILSEVRRMKLNFEGIGLANQGLRSSRFCAVDFAVLEACRILTAQAKSKGVDIRAEVPALPTLPFNDAVIRAIVFNLVTNSIHACRADDVITVSGRLTAQGRDLVLTVADTGCGMAPEVLSRCTELFFTTKANGSGIGLALCLSVLEKIGGELAIRSEEGRGTVVHATMPISEPAER